MRLTNVAQMALPPGRLHSYGVRATRDPGVRLPISFDQRRHVGEGQRPGSWMGIAVRIPSADGEDRVQSLEHLARAWDTVVTRHGTLRTVFSLEYDDELMLHEVTVLPGEWREHPVPAGRATREVLREVMDANCAPFERPSHRLAVVDPDPAESDRRLAVVLAADHSHVDMWTLLVLVRDLLTCLEDLRAGRDPGTDLPPVPTFAEHTRALMAMPAAPPSVQRRWFHILDAEGGKMPRFALPLGELDPVPAEVVEIRDVLDADEAHRLAEVARSHGVRMVAEAIAVLTRVTTELAQGRPLRAVFPVHSRHEDRWHDAAGWYITNAVLECDDADPAAVSLRVKEAIELGSWPLAPILNRYGGMPIRPGMFAISWLDARRLPVRVDPGLEVQYVSASIRTDGVMIWFVVNDTGLHLRCRYPDTPLARENVGRWLDEVESGLRALVS